MHKYRLYYKKLSRWYDPEQTFLALYADKKYTFWLDNNMNQPDQYSYMGVASKKIEYTLSNHTLSISNNANPPPDGQKLRQNIFTYLKKELLSWKGVAGVEQRINSELACESSFGDETREKKRSTGPLFDFTGGFVGYFGYEMKTECCPEQLSAFNSQRSILNSQFPDTYFFFIDKFLSFDHRQKYLYLVALSKNKETAKQWFSRTENHLEVGRLNLRSHDSFRVKGVKKTPTFTFARSRRQYLKDIRTCQKHLIQGTAYQICLTNQIASNIKTNWLDVYRTLRSINPAPASAYINFGNFALLSSSPEQFLRVDKKNWVTSKPMKGTVARSDNPEKDKRLAKHLGKTEKDYAENIMIVDLMRNDLGKVCVIGSIKVTKPLEVQTCATVHQLVSTIKGKLRPGITIIDLLKASFPGGSMTGTPKIAACEIIAKLENTPRGIYSGAFGFLSLNGTANLAMTIRTIIATKNQLSFGTGGAILSDSIPQEEYDEMLLKTQALIKAIKKTT